MRKRLFVILIGLLLISGLPTMAQGGPGTKDFAIRDFGACINLPDFTKTLQPDAYNTVYEVPGLFSINFAEYLMPLAAPPATSAEIYNAMIALLNTVSASDYTRIGFDHPEYVSAAVEFTLDGKRMFGMIYRNQNDKLFFLFADKVEGFDMLAIGRAIFAADGDCNPTGPPVETAAQGAEQSAAVEVYGTIRRDTTWSGEIHVIGDIHVDKNVTLTILPGTEVRVAAHSDIRNLSTKPASALIRIILISSLASRSLTRPTTFPSEFTARCTPSAHQTI
ncbi:hypothetical protein ACFLYO_05280 [Chloroflexota bacterium]